MVLLTTFLLIVSVLTLYHFWFQSQRSTKLALKMPGPKPLPILGNALMVFNKNSEELMKLALQEYVKFGTLGRFWLANRLFVVLSDPRDVELVLGSSVHLEKSPDYHVFQPWLGDGLLISKGDKWKAHRKMIAPTFHQSILKTFIPIFNNNVNDVIQMLRREVVGKVTDIHDYMSGVTVDILLETVMGVKKARNEKTSFQYAKAVLDMCGILQYRQARFWLVWDFIFSFTQKFKEQVSYLKIIHGLTDRVIKDKKINFSEKTQKDESLYINAVKETEKEIKEVQSLSFGTALKDDLDEDDEIIGEKKRLAFLDFMIEASHTEGNKLSDEEIREEVNTIMFEGHDTTAAASSFFMCILGVYPEIQEKVYEEIKEIFQGSNRPVTFNDTLQMKYLQRVLLETLRLYPPVPIISRVNREEIKLVSGDYMIPKNTTVIIPPFIIHRDAKYFPNPDKFDPDNFLPERCQHRHYYSFIPFSAGPRSCVGRKYAMLKLKILLSAIVRNFKITSVVSEKDFKLQGDIILKRADGFRVILENRV